MNSLLIKNGQIALHGKTDFQQMDILIENGKIITLGSNVSGDKIIDAAGYEIYPGAIDAHVHFDEPGYTDREDFYHGSSAAASGGVTTVIDMPCTSIPPITSLSNLQNKLSYVEQHSVIDFAFHGGVSAQCFEGDIAKNMNELAPFVTGFKSYFISGMDSFRQLDFQQFSQVLKAAKSLKRPVLLHAEDYNTVTQLEAIEKKKGSGWGNYYRSRPENAEIIAVENAIRLAEEANSDLHIVHVGTAKAAELIAESPNVSGETCPHYLAFSNIDLERIGSSLKTAPVVKSPGNASALWEAIRQGQLSFVTSDHAPAPNSQKNTGSIWSDYSGIPGTGTLFPYLYSEGFRKGNLPLSRFLEIISENPAKRYRLNEQKGRIAIGMDADLIFVNPHSEWVVKGYHFLSKGKLTPFEGMVFQGQVERTFIRGQEVYNYKKGILTEPGFGNFLKPY